MNSLKNLVFFILLFNYQASHQAFAQQGSVVEITIDQAITPATDDFLKELSLIHISEPTRPY